MSIIRYDPLREAMQQMRHHLFHQQPFEQPYEEAQGTAGGWSPLVDVFEDSAHSNDNIERRFTATSMDASIPIVDKAFAHEIE